MNSSGHFVSQCRKNHTQFFTMVVAAAIAASQRTGKRVMGSSSISYTHRREDTIHGPVTDPISVFLRDQPLAQVVVRIEQKLKGNSWYALM